MKKPLLLGIIGLTIAALTVTTLYAQTVTGASVIDKMKAAVHSFTLGAQLGQIGLESSPIAGKKTGDILTAGEWNRVLELLGQGGGGGWENVLLTDTNAFDENCIYRASTSVDDLIRYTSGVNEERILFGYNLIPGWIGGYITKDAKGIFATNSNGNFTVNILEKFCGGTGGSGGSSGGDGFTFLDTEKTLITSGVTTADKVATTLDISTIAGVTIPPRAKAIQVYVQCNNYTTANQATSLFLGKSTTSLFPACQSNGMLSANDVDSSSIIIPLAPDGKSIVYRYDVPSADTGGQIVVSLRGFITE